MFVFSVFGGFNYAVVYSFWTTDGIGCTLGGTSIRKSIEYYVLVAYTCTLYRYVYVRPLSILGHYDFFFLCFESEKNPKSNKGGREKT